MLCTDTNWSHIFSFFIDANKAQQISFRSIQVVTGCTSGWIKLITEQSMADERVKHVHACVFSKTYRWLDKWRLFPSSRSSYFDSCSGFSVAVVCRMVDFPFSRVHSPTNRQSSSFLFISSRRLLQVGVDVAYLRRDTRYTLRSDPMFFLLPFAISSASYFQCTQPRLQHIQQASHVFIVLLALVAFGLLYFHAHEMVLLNDCTHFLAFDKKKASVWNVNDVVHKNVQSMARRYPVAS